MSVTEKLAEREYINNTDNIEITITKEYNNNTFFAYKKSDGYIL